MQSLTKCMHTLINISDKMDEDTSFSNKLLALGENYGKLVLLLGKKSLKYDRSPIEKVLICKGTDSTTTHRTLW